MSYLGLLPFVGANLFPISFVGANFRRIDAAVGGVLNLFLFLFHHVGGGWNLLEVLSWFPAAHPDVDVVEVVWLPEVASKSQASSTLTYH